jgi:hypothetical protein
VEQAETHLVWIARFLIWSGCSRIGVNGFKRTGIGLFTYHKYEKSVHSADNQDGDEEAIVPLEGEAGEPLIAQVSAKRFPIDVDG